MAPSSETLRKPEPLLSGTNEGFLSNLVKKGLVSSKKELSIKANNC